MSKFEPLPMRWSLKPSLLPALMPVSRPELQVSPVWPDSPVWPESPESPESQESPELLEPRLTVLSSPLLPAPPQPPLKWLPPPLDSPWKIPINEKLAQGRQYEAASYPWEKLSIYRVPKPFRDVDQTAYTPQIVAIGPYHRNQSHLSDMERHKWRALHCALHRKGHDLSHYLEACRSLEFRARACYEASSLSISSDELVESLVIDAIFILELFRGVSYKDGFPGLGYHPKDPVFTFLGIMQSLKRDMLLLENQLPYFILDRIIELQELENSSDLLARLTLSFFGNLMPTNTRRPSREFFDSLKYAGGAVHCLDFFRLNILLEGSKAPSMESIDDLQLRYINHSVAELRAAGFGFRPVESVRFWDIKFENGVLHIPRFFLHDTTKSLFLNLIAFEQCHLKCHKHITTYVVFMDKLINSEEDVRYLHHRRIIENFLGNDGEVGNLFNLLGKDVPFNIEECYLSDLFKQVNIYYNNKRNAWRASLEQKYFSNPWAIISLVAAIVMLLLTFGQTFYSIYGYYKPN